MNKTWGISLMVLVVNATAGAQVAMAQATTAQVLPRLASAPSISAGSPVGLAAAFGYAYAGGGISYLNSTSSQDYDGSAVLGAGFANPYRGFGAVDVGVNIISLRNDFADSGSFNATWHRAFPGGSLAVGAENLGAWGDADETPVAAYTAASFFLGPEVIGESDRHKPFTLTLGAGTGRLRRVTESGRRQSEVAPFGAVAWRFHPRASIIFDRNSSFWNLGLSWVPFRQLPVTATLVASDVGQHLDRQEGAAVTLVVGAALPVF